MAEHGSHDWMESAVKHPGALTEEAKKAGKTLSEFEREHHDSPRINRQIALAKAFKKASRKREG
jgi:hypothetical protein